MNETDNTPEKLWPVLGEPDWERISKIAKPSENMKFGGVLRGCWSEGEMVGYATCMIEQVKPLKQFIELNHNERLSALLSKQAAELSKLRQDNERYKEALQCMMNVEHHGDFMNAFFDLKDQVKAALQGE